MSVCVCVGACGCACVCMSVCVCVGACGERRLLISLSSSCGPVCTWDGHMVPRAGVPTSWQRPLSSQLFNVALWLCSCCSCNCIALVAIDGPGSRCSAGYSSDHRTFDCRCDTRHEIPWCTHSNCTVDSATPVLEDTLYRFFPVPNRSFAGGVLGCACI